MTLEKNTAPIEVWLTQESRGVAGRVVFSDETVRELDVRSLSLGGAQREITGWLISQGYEPVSPWRTENERGR